jgi:hypothetical protein
MVDMIDFSSVTPDEESYMTKSEYSAIISAMRRIFSRSEFAKEVRRRAKSEETGPRGGIMTNCSICGKAFKPKEIELHHEPEVVEIGKHYTDYTLDELKARLWCGYGKLIPLCKSCHSKITAEQQEERHRIDKEERKGKKDEKEK